MRTVVVALIVAGAIAGCAETDTTGTTSSPPSSTQHAPKKHMTAGQKNALQSARDYLSQGAFSKAGLFQQLSSSAGEGYRKADARFAVNHVGADWDQQAVKSAREYLSQGSFSKAALIEQLSSSAGEGFTLAQARRAANKVYR